MNRRTLKKVSAIGIGAALVFTLACTAIASRKNPVTRPFKCKGHSTLVIDMSAKDWPTEISSWGEATHIGRFRNTGFGYFLPHESSGTIVAANGDQIKWEIHGGGYAYFTGGTGRFEGVTGGHTIVSSTPVVTYPEPGIMVVVSDYTGEGTITY